MTAERKLYKGPHGKDPQSNDLVPLRSVTDLPSGLSEWREAMKGPFRPRTFHSILTEEGLDTFGHSLNLDPAIVSRHLETLKSLCARFQTSALDWKAGGNNVPLILSLEADLKNKVKMEKLATKMELVKVGNNTVIFSHEQTQNNFGVTTSTGQDTVYMAPLQGMKVKDVPKKDYEGWTKCSKKRHVTEQEDVSRCSEICGDENLAHKSAGIVNELYPEYFQKRPFDGPIALGYMPLTRGLIEAEEQVGLREVGLRIKTYKVRFNAPVFVGETGVVTYIRASGEDNTYEFAVVEQERLEQTSGKPLLEGQFTVGAEQQLARVA